MSSLQSLILGQMSSINFVEKITRFNRKWLNILGFTKQRNCNRKRGRIRFCLKLQHYSILRSIFSNKGVTRHKISCAGFLYSCTNFHTKVRKNTEKSDIIIYVNASGVMHHRQLDIVERMFRGDLWCRGHKVVVISRLDRRIQPVFWKISLIYAKKWSYRLECKERR